MDWLREKARPTSRPRCKKVAGESYGDGLKIGQARWVAVSGKLPYTIIRIEDTHATCPYYDQFFPQTRAT